MNIRTPVPYVKPPPRNGHYEDYFPDSNQLCVEGTYEDGLKTGVWKSYYSNGQIQTDCEWKRGVQHGHEREWTRKGQQICECQHHHGKRVGKWTWWHNNGNFKQEIFYVDGLKHGETSCNDEEGRPQSRGAYFEDKLDGVWTRWNERKFAKIETIFWRGECSGTDTHWYEGDVVAEKRHYKYHAKHGLEETFYRDGKPKFRGKWTFGLGVGTHEKWDSEGNRSTQVFIDGLYEEVALDTEAIHQLIPKLSAATCKSEKADLLTSVAGFEGRTPLLLKLWKDGLYDVPADPQTWQILRAPLGLMSSDDIMTFLKTSTNENVHGQHLPYWSIHLDRLVMYAYEQDPGPFDEGWESLPDLNKKALHSCCLDSERTPETSLKMKWVP